MERVRRFCSFPSSMMAIRYVYSRATAGIARWKDWKPDWRRLATRIATLHTTTAKHSGADVSSPVEKDSTSSSKTTAAIGASIKDNVVIQTLNTESAATSSSVAEQKSPQSSFPGKSAFNTMQTSSPFIDLPLTSMRKIIAKRMTHSKTTIPYWYATVDCQMDELLSVRRKVMRQDNVKFTVNDLMIKAAALTLQRLPESNSRWTEEEDVQKLSHIDISVAVALEEGLITPIVKGANQLTVPQISVQMKELAGRARIRKLKPEEYQGGTFGITNLGTFGIKEFYPIINPPQSAILGVAAIEAVPVLLDNGERAVSRKLCATLSCDARVFNYELACQWLEIFQTILQNPRQEGLL